MITLLKSIFGSLFTAISCFGANMLLDYLRFRKEGLSDASLDLSMSVQITMELFLASAIAIACFLAHLFSWKQFSELDWPSVLADSFLCVVVLIVIQLPWFFFGSSTTEWTHLAYFVGLPLAALGMTSINLRYINRMFKS